MLKALFPNLERWEPFWKYTLYALIALTVLDFVLWPFKTQTALFFEIFWLAPAWLVWTLLNPHLQEEEKNADGEEGEN
jgi:membrane protein implicated in regulation of membrane protease activity